MYYLWKNTPYGIIRVSCAGLYDFANDIFKSKLRLYSVTLSPSGKKEHADLTLVISEEDLTSETKAKIEEHITSVLKPMGLRTLIVWSSPERGIMPLIQSPYAWAGIASCTAMIITAGFKGFFWTAFWGLAVWFTIKGMKFIAGRFGNA
ncbi:MAG: hypothetical protein IJR27_03855 [Synergistaceae bacterium]|nr:hypothetical protein [Synergistaceae bacterium]MBQ9574395.1 hypothetical protein [Synergistaceae bacterium]